MSRFANCDDSDESVRKLANEILAKHETHKPVLDAKVKLDLVFAYADQDEDGNPTGYALVSHGFRVFGVTKKIALKDRSMGRGDAEIVLDGDYWEEAKEAEKRALLDHELHHIEVKKDEDNVVLKDDLGRPLIRLRKHDVEVGWFKVVAERNGAHSLERVQAEALMTDSGQYFWPDVLRLLPDREKEKKPVKAAA